MSGKNTLDAVDKKILQCLQHDASLTIKEIAEHVHLSTTPCWKRVQNLEDRGIIRRRVALLEPKSVEANVTVFILIRINDHSIEWAENFNEEVIKMDEILAIYRVSGEHDYMMQAIVRDIEAYDSLLKQIVTKFDLKDVTSIFSIEQVKYTTELPVR